MKRLALARVKPVSLGKLMWVLSVVLMAVLFSALAPRAAAQNDGSISGQIMDITGKPWPDIGIQSVSDQGAKADAKTDSNGKYSVRNLRAGVYTVYVQLPAPNKPFEVQCRVQGGNDVKVDVNFKDVVAKQGAEAQEALKKQEEEKQKFQNMKGHFDAGVALLDQVKQAKSDLAKAPADQRDTLKQQVADLSGKAVTEMEGAKAAAPEKDPKSVELDPANAAQTWRNIGITLYNANRLGDAVEPLKKSAELDPKNAQTWYLLGAALVYKMTIKRVGDKDVPEFAPGTIEAYQKAIELDPNGPYGTQAKQGLEQLQLIAPGIDMRVSTKKKKP
jgi:tetratricopeptide (TPR) repeat protein